MKLCKDCHYHSEHDYCDYVHKNIVNGNSLNHCLSCGNARGYEWACGINAKCFKAKNVKTYTFFEALKKAYENPGMKFKRIDDVNGNDKIYIFYYDDLSGVFTNEEDKDYTLSGEELNNTWVEKE